MWYFPYQAIGRTRIHNPNILFVNTVLVFFKFIAVCDSAEMPHKGTVIEIAGHKTVLNNCAGRLV